MGRITEHLPVVVATFGVGLALLGSTERLLHATGVPPRADAESDKLPPMARDVVASRMKDHAVDMNRLMTAVITLDRDTTHKLAQRLADDERLARPVAADEAMLNSQVPPKFFELQDSLRVSARALAEAAQGHDDKKLAKAFGSVASTCVACHSRYLSDEPAK